VFKAVARATVPAAGEAFAPTSTERAVGWHLSKLVNLRADRKPISDARTATYVILSTGSGPGGRWFKSIRPDHFIPHIQQLYAAFLEATALSFGCESCDRLVPQVGPQCRLGEQKKEKSRMRFWQREEVFLTVDQGIEYQQNLTDRNIAIIIFRTKSNRLKDSCLTCPLAWCTLNPFNLVRSSESRVRSSGTHY